VAAVLLGLLAVVALTSSRERPRVSGGADPGRDAGPSGTGLGLAIVRTIAGAHGASVDLAPNPSGAGLCIAATFPAKSEAYA